MHVHNRIYSVSCSAAAAASLEVVEDVLKALAKQRISCIVSMSLWKIFTRERLPNSHWPEMSFVRNVKAKAVKKALYEHVTRVVDVASKWLCDKWVPWFSKYNLLATNVPAQGKSSTRKIDVPTARARKFYQRRSSWRFTSTKEWREDRRFNSGEKAINLQTQNQGTSSSW